MVLGYVVFWLNCMLANVRLLEPTIMGGVYNGRVLHETAEGSADLIMHSHGGCRSAWSRPLARASDWRLWSIGWQFYHRKKRHNLPKTEFFL